MAADNYRLRECIINAILDLLHTPGNSMGTIDSLVYAKQIEEFVLEGKVPPLPPQPGTEGNPHPAPAYTVTEGEKP